MISVVIEGEKTRKSNKEISKVLINFFRHVEKSEFNPNNPFYKEILDLVIDAIIK